MRYSILVPCLLIALTAFSCAENVGSAGGDRRDDRRLPSRPVPSAPVSVTGTEWVLARLGTDAALPAEVRGRPWFRLDPGDKRRVTGNGGVNLLSGTYELSGRALQFGPMISTKRAGSPELMQQESRFLAALESTATAELTDRRLVLRDAGDAALAEFEATGSTPYTRQD